MRYPIRAVLILGFLTLLAGCATTSPTRYSTLYVVNNSGGVVKVFASYNGHADRLGRAYPGVSCMKTRQSTDGSIRFGIQHLAQRTEWSDAFYYALGLGWYLQINQPNQSRFDMIGVSPSPRCR